MPEVARYDLDSLALAGEMVLRCWKRVTVEIPEAAVIIEEWENVQSGTLHFVNTFSPALLTLLALWQAAAVAHTTFHTRASPLARGP